MTSTTTRPGTRPNRKIWSHANSFLQAAELCWEHGIHEPLAVNSALAIELYLKSFLAIDLVKDERSLVGFTTERPKRGHNFIDLIEEIDSDDKTMLFDALNHIDSTTDWYEEFKKHENTFTDIRYWYESDIRATIKPEIVDFAKQLGDAVLAVGKTKHA
ncbi:MAG: HEPN domain-containing protein [Pseudomonadales bacterium]|nr:HEPN domain-containing protein [Balneolaceae bacterium]MBO6598023.1 HEPN domain-containing protein [Pseudomonadales bacterium]